jgi:hypothetical protein
MKMNNSTTVGFLMLLVSLCSLPDAGYGGSKKASDEKREDGDVHAKTTDANSSEACRAAWGPKPAEGISGKAYDFALNGAYINIEDSKSLDISGNEMTISVWIRPKRTDYVQMIVAKSAGGDETWMVAIDPRKFGDGKISFYLELEGCEDNLGSNKAVRIDTWHHLVCVRR